MTTVTAVAEQGKEFYESLNRYIEKLPIRERQTAFYKLDYAFDAIDELLTQIGYDPVSSEGKKP